MIDWKSAPSWALGVGELTQQKGKFYIGANKFAKVERPDEVRYFKNATYPMRKNVNKFEPRPQQVECTEDGKARGIKMVKWQDAPEDATHYGGKMFWKYRDGKWLGWATGFSVWFEKDITPLIFPDYKPRPTAQEWPEDDTRINNIGLNRAEDDMGHYDELREAEQKPVEAIRNKYDRQIIGKYKTGNCTVDVYRVLDAFKTGSAAIDHAVKKLLCAGMRGVKDKRQDYLEAIQSIEAELKLLEDKGL